MKKRILACILVMLMAVLAGCGGEKTIAFSISDASGKLLDSGAFTDTLTKCDTDKVTALYGVDVSLLAEYEVYIGTGATAEELAVFRLKDSSGLEAVKTACETRVADQKKACEGYLPNEIPKLDSPVLRTAGDYVVLVISNDNAKVNEVLDAYMK